ncbi:MAG: protein translocase subunit SecD [Halothiobacillaceae bacterium]|jgi:preprotein translocase subunit SecD|nr:protein translocase subunit SecD [Halothiobacillaceae bacterium]MDY0049260.1 protein translocase subunit SecD [Halothiobacillaceae bacterium]
MNRYPLWKNLLIFLVVAAAFLYALPNLYGEDPAVQVSNRTQVISPEDQTRIKTALDRAGIPYSRLEIQGESALVRFADTEAQLKAGDLLRQDLGSAYSVALNLAPATPDWLRALNAKPMYLGLDLRGGVHFLMEVDMAAATRQALERNVEDMRRLMREQKIRYVTASVEGDSIVLRFADAAERETARSALSRQYEELRFADAETDGKPVLRAQLTEAAQTAERKAALEQNITTLRNRVNELGVAEPVIQQQGDSRIVVQLPGVQDTVRAKEILGATATLEFRLVEAGAAEAEDAARSGHVPPSARLYRERNGSPVLLKRQVIITGDQITGAASGLDTQSGSPAVFVNLDGQGAKRMSDITSQNIGKPMAVVFIEHKSETVMENGQQVKKKRVVEEVINIATIRDQLSNRFQISGLDSTREARDLALLLRAGALRAPIEIVEERTVGPSLGKENINAGVMAAAIGFVAVALFMIVYYSLFGVFANIALFVNLVLIVAVLSLLQATLTLPGIAGIVLTLGMAVDANVLINERIREELRNGNSPQAAISAGYDRAFGTILDANLTTLLAALALFAFGTGPIKGFAVTLSIGILASMFTAILVTRAVVNLVYGRQARLKSLAIGGV